MPIEHSDVTSVHRVGHVSNVDPGAVGAYHAWIDTSTTPATLKVRNAGNSAWLAVGQIPTASNLTGAGRVFKQKVGENFEFRTLVAINPINVAEGADTLTFTLNYVGFNAPLANGFYSILLALDQTGTSIPSYREIYNQAASSVIDIGRIGVGQYSVQFDASSFPVNETLVHVTYGTNTNSPASDGIIVSGRRVAADMIEIHSYNAAGAAADLNCDNLAVTIMFPY